MTLHLISSARTEKIAECLSHCTAADAIVTMNTTTSELIDTLLTDQPATKTSVYRLIQEDNPTADAQISSTINMAELVELTVQHNPIVSW